MNPTLSTAAAAAVTQQSVFAGLDVCGVAGLALPTGAARPLFEDEVWDFTDVIGLPVQMPLANRRFDFTAILESRWRVVARELILALLAPRHPAVGRPGGGRPAQLRGAVHHRPARPEPASLGRCLGVSRRSDAQRARGEQDPARHGPGPAAAAGRGALPGDHARAARGQARRAVARDGHDAVKDTSTARPAGLAEAVS